METNIETSRQTTMPIVEDFNLQPPFPLWLLASGVALVLFFIGTLAIWSYLAPVEGAVVSPGIVSAFSHRKQIQHLEGGIVQSIHIKDGDFVKPGQLLIKLRDIKPSSKLSQLEAQYNETLAIIARLIAQRDNLEKIIFPDELLNNETLPSINSVITGQINVLKSQRALFDGKQVLIDKQIVQTGLEINGLKERIKEKELQKRLLQKELRALEKALKKNLIPKLEILKKQQRLTEINDELIAFRTKTGQLEHDILRLDLQKSEGQSQRIASITEQLREYRAQRYDLSQQVIAARDVLGRTSIKSPIEGVVVNMQIHSHDGVIQEGETLMEILPANDELIVETYINPEDIDEVWVGMSADVRLTSQNRRRQVPIEATVLSISADRLTNQQTGLDYYSARVKLSQDSIKLTGADLVAGMGAEVYLKTEPRSPLEYLLEPVMRTLNLGLREG